VRTPPLLGKTEKSQIITAKVALFAPQQTVKDLRLLPSHPVEKPAETPTLLQWRKDGKS
jgi:hypothetical protein